MLSYACIKNSVVENIVLFEELNQELIDSIIQENEYDQLVEAPEDVAVGYQYIDSNFISNLTYLEVPNVVGMDISEAQTLLEGLGLDVVIGESTTPAIYKISVISNKLTVETMSKNYCQVGDSVEISYLENEDLNGTYEIISVLDENKFTVNKDTENLEEVQVPYGRIKVSAHAGKIISQSIPAGEPNVLQNSTIIINPLAEQIVINPAEIAE
jgi:hypothetical protein